MARDKTVLYCSFCGKTQHEVRKLIAGPNVFICNECTDLCHDIAHEADILALPQQRPVLATFDAYYLRTLLDDAASSARKAAAALHEYQDKMTEAARQPEERGQVVGFGERGEPDGL